MNATLLRRHVALRIRQARERVGLSQLVLAERLSVAPRTYQYWESGEHAVPTDRLPAIAATLEQPIAWFFQDADEVPPEPAVDERLAQVAELLGDLLEVQRQTVEIQQEQVAQMTVLQEQQAKVLLVIQGQQELLREQADALLPPEPEVPSVRSDVVREPEPPTDLAAYRARRVEELTRTITEGDYSAASTYGGVEPPPEALEAAARMAAEIIVERELAEREE